MARKVRQINDLVIDEISLVDKGANQHAKVTIAKSADGERENTMDIFDESGQPLDPEALELGQVVFDEDGTAYLFELDEDPEGAVQEQELEPVGKSANPFQRSEPVRREPVGKSYGESIREELSKALTDRDRDEVIAKALSRFDEMEKTVSKAQQAAEHERTIRLEREYTEIAKSYSLPVQDDVLGGVLMRAAEALSYEDCSVIAKCLEAAGEVLFEEYGNIGGGDNSDVLAQVNAFTDTKVSKADGISKELLTSQVFEENPSLYDEYLAERQGR